MQILKSTLYCALLVACLAGCGQKGPLYLPDAQQPPAEPDRETTEQDEHAAAP